MQEDKLKTKYDTPDGKAASHGVDVTIYGIPGGPKPGTMIDGIVQPKQPNK